MTRAAFLGTPAAFFGTPAAAVPVLAALTRLADVALVVTRADRPAGRSRQIHAPPVKQAALEWGLDVAQPGRAGEVAAEMRRRGVQVAVLAAYGQLIRPELLETPPYGFVNVHFSVLPRWRGAAPVERAILAGDATSGVTLMVMDEGLDTGPVLATAETEIGATETGGVLTARLAALGGSLLEKQLPSYLERRLAPIGQDDTAATLAPKLTTAEAQLDSRGSAAAVLRAVRAFHPRPGAWLMVDGEKRLNVLTAAPSDAGVAEGRIEVVARRVVLGVAGGSIELTHVQPDGKAPMAATAWMNGRRGEPAEVALPQLAGEANSGGA